MGGIKIKNHLVIVSFLASAVALANGASARFAGSSGKHFFVDYSWKGFSLEALQGYTFRPACLKKNGLRLLVIDPGHDDSAASRRSDARVRGGSGRLEFLWPQIHEGQLNAAVSWMLFETILRDPVLSENERDELRTMIRFSRYPGERSFGQYETEAGYYGSTQGAIDDKVTNRRERVNTMLQKHRVFTGAGTHPWAASFSDVQDYATMISVHANSSDFFNEGDLTWLIRPRSVPGGFTNFITSFRKTFSNFLGALTQIQGADSGEVRQLRSALRPSFAIGNISTSEHSDNLRMLAPELGNSRTVKMLTEGFVMNGKAGNLARRQLDGSMSLTFSHGGHMVQKYLVSDVYIQYARSLAAGIGEVYGCR